MPFSPREVERCLLHKLCFVRDNRDHRFFTLELPGLPTIRTKVSHGRREIGRTLEGLMAKQLRVRVSFFREMVGCSKACEDYHRQIRDDPYPPWNIRVHG
jgi:hypothetical protein